MHRIKGKEPDQEAIISTIIGDRAAPSLLEGYDAIEDITLNDSGFYDEKLPDGPIPQRSHDDGPQACIDASSVWTGRYPVPFA